jgi:hypothetical protein
MSNYDKMLDFGGTIYYLDIERFNKLISLKHPKGDEIIESVTKELKNENDEILTTETITTKRERDIYIHQTTYELFREMIDIILNDNEEIDEGLGLDRALDKMTIPYKIAFNTLIKNGILVEVQ